MYKPFTSKRNIFLLTSAFLLVSGIAFWLQQNENEKPDSELVKQQPEPITDVAPKPLIQEAPERIERVEKAVETTDSSGSNLPDTGPYSCFRINPETIL